MKNNGHDLPTVINPSAPLALPRQTDQVAKPVLISSYRTWHIVTGLFSVPIRLVPFLSLCLRQPNSSDLLYFYRYLADVEFWQTWDQKQTRLQHNRDMCQNLLFVTLCSMAWRCPDSSVSLDTDCSCHGVRPDVRCVKLRYRTAFLNNQTPTRWFFNCEAGELTEYEPGTVDFSSPAFRRRRGPGQSTRYISTWDNASTESDRRACSTVGSMTWTRAGQFDIVSSSSFRYSHVPGILITPWYDQFRCALFTDIFSAFVILTKFLLSYSIAVRLLLNLSQATCV